MESEPKPKTQTYRHTTQGWVAECYQDGNMMIVLFEKGGKGVIPIDTFHRWWAPVDLYDEI